MSGGRSIRARLVVGAAIVLLTFMAVAGLAVQRAHADSLRESHFARLQGTIYLLLAGAELDANGALVMPAAPAEPRLSLPGSGLYASIVNQARQEQWRSASAVGMAPPFRRDAPVGEWRFESLEAAGHAYLAVSYGVRWSVGSTAAPLSLSVLEDQSALAREAASFRRTLWSWLGGASVLLLLSQTLLLEWGLAPLRRVAGEVRRVESGEQSEVEGAYPAELAPLTDNLNTLIRQERLRQQRYREALSFLAHSLKTPLAVLRTALGQPETLPAAVAREVGRMDDIVQHQLGRAAAGGAARFAPQLTLAPVLERIRDSLQKVHAGKGLAITLACPPALAWRIDEGDAFEVLGNLMDNAAKWARTRIDASIAREPGGLRIRIEDDGPGFSDTESVLRIHVRGDERVPGHGVGLAVVNDIVASHGGALVLGRGGLGGGLVDVLLPAS